MSNIKNYPSTRSIKKTGRIIYSDDGVHSSQITVQELYNQIKAFMNKYSKDYEVDENAEASDVDRLDYWRSGLLSRYLPFISPISWTSNGLPEDMTAEEWNGVRYDSKYTDFGSGAIWNNTGTNRLNMRTLKDIRYRFKSGSYSKLFNTIANANQSGNDLSFHFRPFIGNVAGPMFELFSLYKGKWDSKFELIAHWRLFMFMNRGPRGQLLEHVAYIEELQDYAYVDVLDTMGYFAESYGVFPSAYGLNPLFTELVWGREAVPSYQVDFTTEDGIDWRIDRIKYPIPVENFDMDNELLEADSWADYVEIRNSNICSWINMTGNLQLAVEKKFKVVFDNYWKAEGIIGDDFVIKERELNFTEFNTAKNAGDFFVKRNEETEEIDYVYSQSHVPMKDYTSEKEEAIKAMPYTVEFYTDNPAIYTRDYVCVDGLLGEYNGSNTLYGLQLYKNKFLISFLRSNNSHLEYLGHGHVDYDGVVTNDPEDYEGIEKIYVEQKPYCKYLYEQIMMPDGPTNTYVDSFLIDNTEVVVESGQGTERHHIVDLHLGDGLTLKSLLNVLYVDVTDATKATYPALSFVKGGYNPQTGYLDGYSDIEDVRVNGVSVVNNHIADISFANVTKITELTLQGSFNTYGILAIYESSESWETDDQDRLHIYKEYTPNLYQANLVADDDITIINGGHWSLGPTAYGPYSLSYMQVRSYEFVMLIFKVKIYSDCAGTFTAFVHDSSHNGSYRPFDPDSSDYDRSYTDFDVRYVPRNVPTTLEIIKIVQPTSSDRSTYTTEQYNLYLDHSVDTDDFSHTSDWTHGVEAYMHYEKKYLVKL